MELFRSEWITIIGAPWSWKTTAWRIAARKIENELKISHIFHDMDDDGLQGLNWWGENWVAKKLCELWDEWFLEAEWQFIVDNYGDTEESKSYNLDTLLFCSTGSLSLSHNAMKHVRERSTVILLHVPIDVLASRAFPYGRADGNTRIVWMNGQTPRFKTLKETLEYRWWIYEAFADIILPYREESPKKTWTRLADLILNTLK